MRTKITIIFESHGLGTATQDNDWRNELGDAVYKALELPDQAYRRGQYPLVTFDVVAVEKLAEE
jgi:hypothetical protein